MGSSPRGRGKLARSELRRDLFRLIPAWAGKTVSGAIVRNLRWAHPRVGGENAHAVLAAPMIDGSSPRGRGKPFGADAHHDFALAHPRVGGENDEAREGDLLDTLGFGASI